MTNLEKLHLMVKTSLEFVARRGDVDDPKTVENLKVEEIELLKKFNFELLKTMLDAGAAGEIPAVKYSLQNKLDDSALFYILDYNTKLKKGQKAMTINLEKGGKLLICHGSNRRDFRGIGVAQLGPEPHAIDDTRFEEHLEPGEVYYMLSCYPAARAPISYHNGFILISDYHESEMPMSFSISEQGNELLYYPVPCEYAEYFGLPIGIV